MPDFAVSVAATCLLVSNSRMITNLRYADDIILLATSEAELQELVDRLDRVSRKYPTHQRRQDQGNDERRHSVLHTHSERIHLEQVDTFRTLGP